MHLREALAEANSPALVLEGENPGLSSDVYAEYLFHGKSFQGIQTLECISEQGGSAELVGAPEPKMDEKTLSIAMGL